MCYILKYIACIALYLTSLPIRYEVGRADIVADIRNC